MATPNEFEYIQTPNTKAQIALMIEDFVELIGLSREYNHVEASIEKSEHTRMMLDAIWKGIESL